MTPSPTPRQTPGQPPRQTPPPVAPDLEVREAVWVKWFAAMEQVELSPSFRDELRARIVDGVTPDAWTDAWTTPAVDEFEARSSVLGRLSAAPRLLLSRLPSRPRAWAAAAVLALAVGTGWWLLPPGTSVPSEPSRLSLAIEDPSLSLFHGLETFDRVGMAPGDLIADWTR